MFTEAHIDSSPEFHSRLSHQDDGTPDVVSPFSNYITPLIPHFQSGLIGSNCRHYQCEWCWFLIHELLAQSVLPAHGDERGESGVIPQISQHLGLGLMAPGNLLVSSTRPCQPLTVIKQYILILFYGLLLKRPFLDQTRTKLLANIIT